VVHFFSIITPSLNQASFLDVNINSVLDQSYSDFEHIIVDGGSRDGTIEILKKYPHLRWLSEPDGGQAQALNKGFKIASGDVFGWLNSDDYYCKGIFQELAKCFDDPSVMVVYGDGYEVDRGGEVKRYIKSRGIQTDDLIQYWKWRYEYVQPSFFFRRDVFEKTGYIDEGLHYTMDHDFFIRLSRGYKFHHLQAPLACYRLHETSKTGKTIQSMVPKYIWELHRVSKRYWGTPVQLNYYRNSLSLLIGVLFSIMKNLLFVPGSKSRTIVKRWLSLGS